MIWGSWPGRSVPVPDGQDDLASRLAAITCPTLVVHGTADAAIPVARAEAGPGPAGRAGHVHRRRRRGARLGLTHPDEVNQAVLEFLTGLDSG